MKKIIGIWIFLLITTHAFAVSQVPDICIIKKDSTQDTLSLFIYPLEDYFELQGDKNLGGFKNCESPACNRGYQAVWLVENDSLFLINIQGCNEQMSWCDETALPNLKAIFGDDSKNNKVFAGWVNGKYRFFYGDEIPHLKKPFFDAERQIVFKAGKVLKNKLVKNVVPRKKAIKVTQSTPEFMLYLVHTNLNWRALPKSKTDKWYAEMTVTILRNGKTRIKLITDTKEEFRAAAELEYLKCFKNLRWYQYKQNGKKVEVSFILRAEFQRSQQIITIIK